MKQFSLLKVSGGPIEKSFTRMNAGFLLIVSLMLFTQKPALSQFTFYKNGRYVKSIQSPAQFLGYKLGERFTPHYRIVDYVRYLSKASERVKLEQYGETYEKRPLLCLFISSPGNLQELDKIQRDLSQLRNIQNQGSLENLYQKTPALAWLSYGVHGNESSSAEAAMQVSYQLAAGTDSLTLAILTRLVVVIDPLLNPDGRDRYVNWFQSVAGKTPNTDPFSLEHDEPWPGGRTNHYYFDLNRDWAWMTQQESQARVKFYRQWYPQLHVDFHEMGYTQTYFFFPPQGPILQDFPPETRKWMKIYGEQIAKAFDQYGWLYYSEEDFDLFYPGYGDSWPSLNGAIGMTYEQAGGGRGGLTVKRPDKTRLSLRDRIHHHFISSMATLATTAAHREARLRDFRKFWLSGIAKAQKADFSGYLILPGTSQERFHDFLQILVQQGIDLKKIEKKINLNAARDLITNEKVNVQANAGSIYIPLVQASTRLLTVLFEPRPAISDTFFYDITSWSLPAAFGLKAYKVRAKNLDNAKKVKDISYFHESESEEKPSYAYIIPWNDIATAGFVSDLIESNVRCYVAKKSFTLNGESFRPGNIIVPIFANTQIGQLHRLIQNLAQKWQVQWRGTNTALTSKGIDLGSRHVAWIKPPRVAVLTDMPVSSNSYGTIWFLFDQKIEMPFSAIRARSLKYVNLNQYNVLIFPDAFSSYESYIDSATVFKIKYWIREGGVAIGIGRGAQFFVDKKLSTDKIKKQKPAQKDSAAMKKQKQETLRRAKMSWEEKQRQAIKDRVPGAILRMLIDTTYPLGYAQEKEIYILKRSKLVFELSDKVHNVGIFPAKAHVAGFLNEKNSQLFENTAAITVEKKGRGKIILFSEDLNFRFFWRGATGLFLNAVMFGSIM